MEHRKTRIATVMVLFDLDGDGLWINKAEWYRLEASTGRRGRRNTGGATLIPGPLASLPRITPSPRDLLVQAVLKSRPTCKPKTGLHQGHGHYGCKTHATPG